MSRYYVGIRGNKKEHTREVFTAKKTPTAESHGHKYLYVIGPFSTKEGAEVMRDYGDPWNPHFQHVSDAEAFARKLKLKKGGKK